MFLRSGEKRIVSHALPLLAARAVVAVSLVVGTIHPLAVDWVSGPGFRYARLAVPKEGHTGFTRLLPAQTGIQFTNVLPASRYMTNHVLLNGSGVAAGDVDGDGRCDLYVCRLEGSNALYRNLGNWRFEDITASAGVACADLTSSGATFADLDGDGDLDLIVNTIGHGTHVFFNDGQGRFTEAPYVLNGTAGGMSLALADVNGQGYLDLYIANYRTSMAMDMPGARITLKTVNGRQELETFNGRPASAPEVASRWVYDAQSGLQELGEIHSLYRNEHGTNFALVPFTDGTFLDADGNPLAKVPRGWGLTAAFHDVNGDGLPDLYVCNDFLSEDWLWINQGGGKFRLIPRLAQRKSCLSSMAVDFADINRDGFVDFLVMDMMSRSHAARMMFMKDVAPPVSTPGVMDDCPQYQLDTLFLNRGDCTFAEIAQLSGLEAAEWAWSCLFLDVDLDGWEDVLVVNGVESAARDLDITESIRRMRASRRLTDAEVFQARTMYAREATANLAFRNRHDLTFEEVGQSWGFDWKGVSSSMALADLDNDGDLDVVVNNVNDGLGVFRNETTAPRIAVRLRGLPPNTHGIGARVRVLNGPVPQTQEMICGGRYLSSDDSIRVFAAGSSTNRLRLEVTWRSGAHSVIENALPDCLYEIDERAAQRGAASAASASAKPEPALFQDVSGLLNHVHAEEAFDDFARQPLLPNKLSQLGPGVSWFDVDGDGWEDLIVGSGRGGQLAAFRNDGRGGFQRLTNAPLAQAVTRDQTTVVGWQRAPGQTVLLAGSANYEDGLAIGSAVRQYDLAAGRIDDSLPATDSSTGPLALADVNGDGELDLFLGGRVIPGKYPQAASSRLMLGDHGTFRPDLENNKVLEGVGLVSGAAFADLNGDGFPDLVLACEWGPIRVFLNAQGRFQEVTRKLGLADYTGWWNGVAVGDFDGDGRLDLVAGNWGRNTKYQAHRSQPLELYYGDFNEDGALGLLEAYYDADLKKVVPGRQLNAVARALPFLREQFTTHKAYASAGVAEVLGERFPRAKVLQARWLESTVFLNRGDHFEAHPLPVEAQMAPAFGVCAADCDGDGHEDVFLAQNFFATQPETPRYDAGRGLWLRGDGRGGFTAMDGEASGVRVYGEQRGAAVCDYDGDGRVDLVVAQNGAATKLFHNVGGKPGLRVRLTGPPGNPTGIGAAVRLKAGQWLGPIHEIQAGSGYWSQDSAVVVLHSAEVPTQIWVRWPGGKEVLAAIPSGARTITVTPAGECRVVAR